MTIPVSLFPWKGRVDATVATFVALPLPPLTQLLLKGGTHLLTGILTGGLSSPQSYSSLDTSPVLWRSFLRPALLHKVEVCHWGFNSISCVSVCVGCLVFKILRVVFRSN